MEEKGNENVSKRKHRVMVLEDGTIIEPYKRPPAVKNSGTESVWLDGKTREWIWKVAHKRKVSRGVVIYRAIQYYMDKSSKESNSI